MYYVYCMFSCFCNVLVMTASALYVFVFVIFVCNLTFLCAVVAAVVCTLTTSVLCILYFWGEY